MDSYQVVKNPRFSITATGSYKAAHSETASPLKATPKSEEQIAEYLSASLTTLTLAVVFNPLRLTSAEFYTKTVKLDLSTTATSIYLKKFSKAFSTNSVDHFA